MVDPDILAARFARCVELFRDAAATGDQKAEFRILFELLRTEPLHLRDQNGTLAVNGTRVAGAKELVQRLGLHNIGEILVPRQPPANDLFALLRALADQPGVEDVPTKLTVAGVVSISVKLAGVELDLDAPVVPQGSKLGTDGILRGSPMTDIASGAVAGVPPITHDTTPPPESALPQQGTAAPGRQTPPPAGAPAPPSTSATPPLRPLAPPAPPLRTVEQERERLRPDRESLRPDLDRVSAVAGQPASKLLEYLEHDPDGAEVGDVLAELSRHIEDAVRANRIEQALPMVATIVRQEQRAPEGSARRNYGIALRRIYTKALLQDVARLLLAPAHRDAAMTVLRRGGGDAVEVLLDLLVSASVVAERRAAFDALRGMTEGAKQLVEMLNHHEWFVVRNVAELVGELGLEQAVPALARHLGHEDERVRKAAALALAKIGSGNTQEPLRRALRDKSPDVRVQVALGVGGRRSSALVMPLVVALDEEQDEAVQRELMIALGRIGTPDAVQALIKAAQPGRLFARKSGELRLAAVEGLRLAATPASLGTLEGLSDDGDKEVKAAAKAAVAELKRKARR